MGISVDPTQPFPTHPTEEFLEEYVFRRLPEALADQVEEHLLICPNCQDVVWETDRFVSALKVAARQPVATIAQVRLAWWNILDALSRHTRSTMILAPVVALAFLTFLTVRRQAQEPSPPVTVSLSSLRGRDPLAAAPAGHPLQLNIETPDLSSGKDYRVEVVDAAGGPVWSGAVTETDGKLVAPVAKQLGKGVYWIRLYGTNAELLREFGMSVN
ncbi:MAG: hypothetical protein JWO19_5781 [Bryobacterales bacterium]|jgi:hypothetical protein|nr:hypothetical protein [Bryobacterales bacterium]